MKKPGEMTVGLVAAVMAVAAAMWIDEARAGDKGAAPESSAQVQKKRKPKAAEVSTGAELGDPNRTDMADIGYELGRSARKLEEAAAEAASKLRGESKEVQADFNRGYQEGYGGSGGAGTAKDSKGKVKTGATDGGTK